MSLRAWLVDILKQLRGPDRAVFDDIETSLPAALAVRMAMGSTNRRTAEWGGFEVNIGEQFENNGRPSFEVTITRHRQAVEDAVNTAFAVLFADRTTCFASSEQSNPAIFIQFLTAAAHQDCMEGLLHAIDTMPKPTPANIDGANGVAYRNYRVILLPQTNDNIHIRLADTSGNLLSPGAEQCETLYELREAIHGQGIKSTYDNTVIRISNQDMTRMLETVQALAQQVGNEPIELEQRTEPRPSAAAVAVDFGQPEPVRQATTDGLAHALKVEGVSGGRVREAIVALIDQQLDAGITIEPDALTGQIQKATQLRGTTLRKATKIVMHHLGIEDPERGIG